MPFGGKVARGSCYVLSLSQPQGSTTSPLDKQKLGKNIEISRVSFRHFLSHLSLQVELGHSWGVQLVGPPWPTYRPTVTVRGKKPLTRLEIVDFVLSSPAFRKAFARPPREYSKRSSIARNCGPGILFGQKILCLFPIPLLMESRVKNWYIY